MLSGLQDMSAWAGQQELTAYMKSDLINCGAYNGQPLFVIRHMQSLQSHERGPFYYDYAVHTCACASHPHLAVCPMLPRPCCLASQSCVCFGRECWVV